MQYLSVCSGIEAATVAWHPLGWEAVAFSEIDAFPNAVLAYHYPTVPNFGDMEKFNDWPQSDVDVLVGGTPCQSFSIAGLRKGLADPRGNLTLGFLGVVARFHPRWFVWENVPGAFSSVSHEAPDPLPPDFKMVVDGAERVEFDEYDADEAHAFACFLAGVSELGYGWAYRVLDAQYFGVPQRRRRVFVVGHSSGIWQRAAAVLFERHSLFRHPPPSREKGPDITGTLGSCSQRGGRRTTDLDGCGAYVPEIVPQAMSAKWHKGSSGPAGDEHHNLVTEDIAAALNAPGRCREDENMVAEAPLLESKECGTHIVDTRVRRLTPLECERLQGFPDNYTDVPGASDSARYRALGNSMAVPVMRWIGERIQQVEEIR